jgi:fatty acid desaturase 2 (delta-6 desaturase)
MNFKILFFTPPKEHHLFPTMPQFKQRQIKDRVRALAEKHGLHYHTMSYSEALRATFKNLEEVAQELGGGGSH